MLERFQGVLRYALDPKLWLLGTSWALFGPTAHAQLLAVESTKNDIAHDPSESTTQGGIMAPMVALPNANELVRLQSAGGADYQLTLEDADALVRMAVFEGGDPAMALWALAQRWILFRDKYVKDAEANDWKTREYVHSLKEMVGDFSQPLNAKWRRDGEFCRPGGKYHGTKFCKESSLKTRDLAWRLSLSQLYERSAEDAAAIETAIRWLRGNVPNPIPRSTNWAAEDVATNYISRHPDATEIARAPADACPACNVFLVEGAARKWPENYVWLRTPSGRVVGTSAGAGLLAGVWRGLTTWWRPVG